MNARNLLAIIPSLLLTPLAAIHAAEPAKPTKPNILFILVDDLAYNDIGCFSYPGDIAPDRKVAPPAYPEKAAYAAPNQAIAMINGKRVSLTPNLDSLATQGVKLTGYHSPASVCSPSRLGLMTGATPGRFNLGGIISEKRGDTCGLPSREVTIAEALKGVGYATAAFGKWHLGTEPQFDPTRNGFDHYWPATGERSGELIRLTEQALAFLDENKAGPFFAYFAPHQPHHPNVPHPDFAGSSEKLLGKRSYMKGDGTTATQEGASAYHDVVHEVDSRIGQLLKKLDDLGIAKNTIVVFTSDNGPWHGQTAAGKGVAGIIGTGYPYRGGKFDEWEGGTIVPAIIRYPGQVPAGVISSEMVSGLDWFSTFVHLAGGTIPTNHLIDSIDVWPFLTGLPKAKSPRPYLMHDRGSAVKAVSDNRFKKFDDGKFVELASDFTERTDANSTNPEENALLTKELAAAKANVAKDIRGLEKSSEQQIVLDSGTGRYVEVNKSSPGSFKVSFSKALSAPLTVNLHQRSGSKELTLSPMALTFTPANWDKPQSVTAKAAASTGTDQYAVFEVEASATIPIREVYLHQH